MKKAIAFFLTSSFLIGLFLYVQTYVEFKKVNPMSWHTGLNNETLILPRLLLLWLVAEIIVMFVYILTLKNKN